MKRKPLPPELTAALTADPLLLMGHDLGLIDDAEYEHLSELQRQCAEDDKSSEALPRRRRADANRTERVSLVSRIMRFVLYRITPAHPR